MKWNGLPLAPGGSEFIDMKGILERAKGFEPSTPTLARLCSTPELRPLWRLTETLSPSGEAGN
jgi:hypothetical protein